ncbi:MAG: hypothetical protein IMHGJWDQ_001644 [Candidatus Fervidibacter sp.]
MRREIPLWLAIVVILVIALVVTGFFVWRSRTAIPGGGPPTPAPGEAQGY